MNNQKMKKYRSILSNFYNNDKNWKPHLQIAKARDMPCYHSTECLI